MQHSRALSQRLTHRINSCVCFVVAVSLLGMVPLGFAGAGSFQRRQPSTIEAEDLIGSAKASGGAVTRQEMDGFGPGWSGNAQLLWKAPKPVDTPIRNWPHLTLLFKPPAEGKYELLLRYTAAPDFGTFRVFVNGNAIGDIDGYAASVSPQARSLGQHKLTAGSHQFIVTVFGKVWDDGWEAIVATVRDADAGYGVISKAKGGTGIMHNYVGRIDPAPRCDGKANVVYGSQ